MRRWKISRTMWGVLFFSIAGCTEQVNPPVPPEPLPPVLSVDPEPGVYRALTLDVTIAAAEPDAELYWEQGRMPELASDKAHRGRFQVHLVGDASLQVLVKDKTGRVWGPYVFEYILQLSRGDGFCAAAKPFRTILKPSETLAVELSYSRPNALSRVEMIIDDKVFNVPIDLAAQGDASTFVIGPFVGDGIRNVNCRVVSSDGRQWPGTPFEILIDGTPPQAVWDTAGGGFNQETWTGAYMATAQDSGSGLASVDACNPDAVCSPLGWLAGAEYFFATALTSGTSFSNQLNLVATDRAGNVSVGSLLPLNLTNFAEEPDSVPRPITLTTEPLLNLSAELGIAPSEVRFLDWAPVTEPFGAISLSAGWNIFLYRLPGRTTWLEFSIYRSGIRVVVPASTSPWLVFSSHSTTPAAELTPIDTFYGSATGVTAWSRAWFSISHLFFVEDINSNGRWDQFDNPFTIASDSFGGAWQSRGDPIRETLSLLPQLQAASATASVNVSCAAVCTGGDRLIFERRTSWAAYPVTHEVMAGVAPAAMVEIAYNPGDVCMFFWDADDNGVLSLGDPRALETCGANGFSLDDRDGEFRFFQGRLFGAAYGKPVTGIVEFLAPSLTSVTRRPLPTQIEWDGLGSFATRDYLTVPDSGITVAFRLWSAGAITVVTAPVFADERTFASFADVQVVDEAGMQMPALVSLSQGEEVVRRITDNAGMALLGVPLASQPIALLAEKEGYLSSLVVTTSTSVELQLLCAVGCANRVTGLAHGYLKDVLGQPISNALMEWESGAYRAIALSNADGYFALPASGGTGLLKASVGGEYRRAVEYSLQISTDTVFVLAELPADLGPRWPAGLAATAPDMVTGPGSVLVHTNSLGYAVEVSGDETGPWSSEWFGISHRFVLPGALPSYENVPSLGFLAPSTNFYTTLDFTVGCGNRVQTFTGGAVVDSPCWAWLAKDGLQTYVLGRVNPTTGFPIVLGMARYNAAVFENAVPAASQELVFRDMLLGRTLRVAVVNGLIATVLPTGVYQVETLAQQVLQLSTEEQTLTIAPGVIPTQMMWIP